MISRKIYSTAEITNFKGIYRKRASQLKSRKLSIFAALLWAAPQKVQKVHFYVFISLNFIWQNIQNRLFE